MTIALFDLIIRPIDNWILIIINVWGDDDDVLFTHPRLCISSVNSEKSLSPLADETQPFVVPFRPYAWNSYSGSDLRHLVQQSFQHHDADSDQSASLSGQRLCQDGANKAALFAERTGEEDYGDYRPTVGVFNRTPVFFPDEVLHGPPHHDHLKTPSELLCSRLILNGAYKCVKCSKVLSDWMGGCSSFYLDLPLRFRVSSIQNVVILFLMRLLVLFYFNF